MLITPFGNPALAANSANFNAVIDVTYMNILYYYIPGVLKKSALKFNSIVKTNKFKFKINVL